MSVRVDGAAVDDLRRRLLVVQKPWDVRKRRQMADWITKGHVILSPWLKTSPTETIVQVIPFPPDARGPWSEELLRAIFPSLSGQMALDESSFILSSIADRALLNLIERGD